MLQAAKMRISRIMECPEVKEIYRRNETKLQTAKIDEGGPVRYIKRRGIGYVALDDLLAILRRMGDEAKIDVGDLRKSLKDLRDN